MSCNLTLSLPSVTKTEFLLTTSIQYRAVKWRNKEENSIRDYKLIQCQILQIDIMSILWQMLGRIANEILRVKVGGGGILFSGQFHNALLESKTLLASKSPWNVPIQCLPPWLLPLVQNLDATSHLNYWLLFCKCLNCSSPEEIIALLECACFST